VGSTCTVGDVHAFTACRFVPAHPNAAAQPRLEGASVLISLFSRRVAAGSETTTHLCLDRQWMYRHCPARPLQRLVRQPIVPAHGRR
jgi:hypothetical protein